MKYEEPKIEIILMAEKDIYTEGLGVSEIGGDGGNTKTMSLLGEE